MSVRMPSTLGPFVARLLRERTASYASSDKILNPDVSEYETMALFNGPFFVQMN